MAKRRGQETLGDMVRTAAVFLVLIVAAVAFLPKSHHPASSQRVDYAAALSVLRAAATFPVLAPQGLAPDWTATNVRTHVPGTADRTTSFHLGFFVASADAYAAYDQSDARDAVSRVLGPGARQTGTTDVAGVGYQSWSNGSGLPALVRSTAGGSTLVVTGKGSEQAMRTLASALR